MQDIEMWKDHVKTEVLLWKNYHNHLLAIAKKSETPILFTRFEDLIDQPEKTLENIFAYVLREPSIEGMVIQERIKEAIGNKTKSCQLYKPKSNGFN